GVLVRGSSGGNSTSLLLFFWKTKIGSSLHVSISTSLADYTANSTGVSARIGALDLAIADAIG
ncbi:MAG TPA: hypothetical protein VGZ47_06155, partial [Gemmataceae bacterium]|nr:hypothetical protein [Gemmataceae bacterium]